MRKEELIYPENLITIKDNEESIVRNIEKMTNEEVVKALEEIANKEYTSNQLIEYKRLLDKMVQRYSALAYLEIFFYMQNILDKNNISKNLKVFKTIFPTRYKIIDLGKFAFIDDRIRYYGRGLKVLKNFSIKSRIKNDYEKAEKNYFFENIIMYNKNCEIAERYMIKWHPIFFDVSKVIVADTKAKLIFAGELIDAKSIVASRGEKYLYPIKNTLSYLRTAKILQLVIDVLSNQSFYSKYIYSEKEGEELLGVKVIHQMRLT